MPHHTAHTIGTLLRAATAQLTSAGVDSPRLSAELMLCHGLGVSRVALVADHRKELTEAETATVTALLDRRAMGEPAAYILGTREFYGRDFAVTPATLIPRPETEHLIETALAALPAGDIRMADLGTGTGCIAITLCAECTRCSGIAVDLSAAALAVAHANARTHGVTNRLSPVRADFTKPLLAPHSLDLMVTNPPYISEPEYAELSPEVRNHEPRTALVPGPSGLEHARILVAEATRAVRPGGLFLMEFGCTQGADVAALFTRYAPQWNTVDIRTDLAGLDRYVFARRA